MSSSRRNLMRFFTIVISSVISSVTLQIKLTFSPLTLTMCDSTLPYVTWCCMICISLYANTWNAIVSNFCVQVRSNSMKINNNNSDISCLSDLLNDLQCQYIFSEQYLKIQPLTGLFTLKINITKLLSATPLLALSLTCLNTHTSPLFLNLFTGWKLSK